MDSFRPAASAGEMATIGHFGRSRDTRKPVEPEQVQQTIADRSSVSATCRAAAAIASAPVRSVVFPRDVRVEGLFSEREANLEELVWRRLCEHFQLQGERQDEQSSDEKRIIRNVVSDSL
jgi:hypothetical protein